MTAAAAPPPARRGKQIPAAAERVFDAKIRPPGLPAGYVPRPRLERLLAGGAQGRLTLVSAHAGTGKTVLLSAWERLHASPVAWVSVDRGDNVGARFWRAIELALDRAAPGSAPAAPRRRRADGDGPVRILERAAAVGGPVALVLDDLHELESPALLDGIDTLVRQAPPELRLVVATRADPPFPLHRLRLAGELSEIRAAELAFSAEEARGLLGEAAGLLSDDGLGVLYERTEGWAAGLRLAALSLRRTTDGDGFVAAFAGDDRSVADYLVSEVLARQTPDRREFLLTTSIAARLSSELAGLLSGREDAYELLEQLEAENLFVTRQGGSRLDFRYHRLFREFLRAELARSRSEVVPELNARAAAWCYAHGEPFTALRHAVAGAAWELADEIAAETWQELVPAGDPTGLRAVLERASAAALRTHRSLALLVAVNLLDTGEAAEGLALAGLVLDELRDTAAAGSSLARYAALAVGRRSGDAVEVAGTARALRDAPAGAGSDDLRRARVQRAVASAHLGAALVVLGELDEAERVLDLAHEQALEEHLDATLADVLGQLALLEAARGRLRRAAAFGVEAAALAERHGGARGVQAVAAELALAWVHLQWDEPDEAALQVERASAAARSAGDAGGVLAAALVGALLDATTGPAGADRGLRRLRSAGDNAGATLPRFLVPTLTTAEARLLAARGDVDAAWGSLDALEDDGAPIAVARAAARARLELAWGRPRNALAELARAPTSSAALRPQAIEVELLAAVAHAEEREREQAESCLDRALELAAVERYRRVFVEGGPAVRTLLVDSVRHGTPHRAFVGELLAAFDRRAPGVEITRPELLEPLSARERAVLRYLPTLMSNTEIAGELFLSVNTVKTHLRSIYRKLGATRRRDAVERARRLELL